MQREQKASTKPTSHVLACVEPSPWWLLGGEVLVVHPIHVQAQGASQENVSNVTPRSAAHDAAPKSPIFNDIVIER